MREMYAAYVSSALRRASRIAVPQVKASARMTYAIPKILSLWEAGGGFRTEKSTRLIAT